MPPIPPHIVCTPFRPPAATFDSRWRTETAVALARGIVADVAFDRFPILADALEEAGCDDPIALLHCRECRVHTTRCWVLGDLLDLPPPVVPRPMTEEELRRMVERVTGHPLPPPAGEPARPRWGWVWMGVAIFVVALVVIGLRTVFRPFIGKSSTYPTQMTSPSTVSTPR